MTLFVTLLLIIVNTIFSLCERSELHLKILDTRIVSLVFQFCRSYTNRIESQVKAFENSHENSCKYEGHNNFRAKFFFQFCRSYANWIESQVKAFEKGHENLHENSWKYKGHNNFCAKFFFQFAFAFTKIRHTSCELHSFE